MQSPWILLLGPGNEASVHADTLKFAGISSQYLRPNALSCMQSFHDIEI